MSYGKSAKNNLTINIECFKIMSIEKVLTQNKQHPIRWFEPNNQEWLIN